MVFTSSLFLFIFLPVTLLLYYYGNPKFYNLVLMFVSLLFYAWGEPEHIVLMLLSIGVNYILGRLMDIARKKQVRVLLLLTTMIVDLGLLFYFKYFNFFVDIISGVLQKEIAIAQIALPIGISFYTFQIMSYVIDVYRGDVKAQKNIVHLALYISFFPQLIAGPIVRYTDIEQQLKHREVSLDKFYEGVLRFMCGFAKKVLLADQLATLVDVAFSGTVQSALLNWLGIVTYTLQIYYDFSGYSDMAIGLGKMFGFEFMENFNFPYISRSIKEFWRRWHISLSTWFRDYVYIPLGGSRCRKARSYLNLVVVFFLTGLWHGASYNFIFWGLYYVVFLVAERMWLGKVLEKFPAWIQHLYTLFIILIGWVFFRAETLPGAMHYIAGMFEFAPDDYAQMVYHMNPEYWFFIFAGIIFAVPHTKIAAFLEKWKWQKVLRDIGVLIVFVIAICYMVGTGFSPFLYFRF